MVHFWSTKVNLVFGKNLVYFFSEKVDFEKKEKLVNFKGPTTKIH